MADQENVRITRAAKRRAAVNTEELPVSKKRVVLGELSNVLNVVVSVNPSLGNEPQKRKSRAKAKAKKALVSTKVKSTTEDVGEKPDIDVGSDDPKMCGPYATDICDYLHKMEVESKRRPLPDYIEKVQKDVTPNMRGILVDWQKLQLLGVSSMLIASKYEEISPKSVEEFCYITDNTYTKDEVVKMEACILKSLKFELGNTTIKTFLRRFIRIAQEDDKNLNLQLEFLSYYLAELSLLDYECIKFLPSLVAASVIFLARFMMQPKLYPWNLMLQKFLGYRTGDMKDCVLIIHNLYLSRRGGGLRVVREKYKQHKFKCVATIPSPPEIPASFLEDLKE
ncbi:cyclin-A3-2-like isoform X2 [Tripterygium wilfordii]|uniref:cyclin-A3-2-like isoform X2 n=1 Tax=Tripterygium wilfordii TaxID=458696 RepID=UPI0018F856E5|nr:cyclin-A3-2-like isoform X2 [Tripterygium wilfordii]